MTQVLFNFDQLSAIPATLLPVREVHSPELNRTRPYQQIVCDSDPLTVERIARAIWDADRLGGVDGGAWRAASEGHREDYRNMARGAILATAAIQAEPEEQP